jgi:hypothetical protein
MKIKVDFTNWMRYAETVNPSFMQAVNSTTTKWEDIGLNEGSVDPNDLSREFEVIDKHLFLLSVIKYGFEFEEIKDQTDLEYAS